MIRKWEMAFWAMLAGTTLQASCGGSTLYGVPFNDDGTEDPPFDHSYPDSDVSDIPGDPTVEPVEDAEADEAEDVDDEDIEGEG